ncbi:MAG TPA: GrpB family protein, partial [Vicinamibacteria bacterium]
MELKSPIVIAPYDPRWPVFFEALREVIQRAMGELAARIEHVGSTAVPGLPAKPILDIDVVIPSGTVL